VNTEQLEKKLEQRPTSPLFSRLASEYLNEGRIDDAIHLCHSGLQFYSTYSTALLILARCFEAQTNYSAALEQINRAIELNPDSPLLRIMHDRLEKAISSNNKQVSDSEEQTNIPEHADISADVEIIETTSEEISQTTILPDESESDKSAYQQIPTSDVEEIQQKEIVQSVDEETDNQPNEIAPEEEIVETIEQVKSEVITDLPSDDSSPTEDMEQATEELKLTQVDTQKEDVEKSDASIDINTGLMTDEEVKQYEGNFSLQAQDVEIPEQPTTEITGGIVTRTLAEIYASQGAYNEALQTYRLLLKQKPEQRVIIEKRIRELEEIIKNKLNEETK